MSYTDKATVIANHIIDILRASDLFEEEDVWYGDSDLIPRVPAATVQSGNKVRELEGAQFRTMVVFEVEIMVYSAKLDETDHVVQEDADKLAEDVEDELHKHPYMEKDGEHLVIHGFVSSVEPGFALRNEDEIMRAARITWRGQSKVRIHG